MLKKFWYGCQQLPDIRDSQLHSILAIGINMGMRFDVISKLQMKNVSVTSDGVTLTIVESIKNSTIKRNYRLREWDGNTLLHVLVYMDPFIALTTWLTSRGTFSGPLFCDYLLTSGCYMLNPRKSLPVKKFTELLRIRLGDIGIGRDEILMYTGQSIKRGSVQLHRSLGLRAEMIMEIIQMKGHHAYEKYCAAFNDCAPYDLPRFSSVHDYIKHAETIVSL